ncbi:MAG: replication initiation protein [Candidatus Thiodiazotropha sp. (ex Ustalcina ferruginea)]|nr:replication initiation protein [Candidatus Thiodiazotropha sp. (ex Ustalcina ferruginea)]
MKKGDDFNELSPEKAGEKQDEACRKQIVEEGTKNVCKSNMLIDANYKLNLVEHRILLACIAELNPRDPVPDAIELRAEDYARIFKTPLKRAYEALQHGSEHLHERTLEVEGQVMHWVAGPVEYLKGEGTIVLRFSKVLKPHLTELRRCFTAYELEKVSSLQKTYSIRLYEQLMQWRSTGELFIGVDDFKKRLGMENEYSQFKNVKRWVIDPAVEELGAKSGLKIKWDVKRRGHKARLLVFAFKEKSISNLLRFPSEEERQAAEPEQTSEATSTET